jgi:hypothetical protein
VAATLAGAAALPQVAPEWVRGAAVETGAAAIGTDAIGTTGTAIGIITVTMMSSLSVTSAFLDGGAGVGAGEVIPITDMGIRTATMDTVTVTRMATVVTAMVITVTGMAMDTAMAAKANTAAEANTAAKANMALPPSRE